MAKQNILALITEIHTDIKWIKQELNGNGKKGLIRQVYENTLWRYTIIGALAIIAFFIKFKT